MFQRGNSEKERVGSLCCISMYFIFTELIIDFENRLTSIRLHLWHMALLKSMV